MADYQPYIKLMTDIIDSGLWAELSVGARTLYPVLLKFSDQNFKQVWPSISTLMKLTGFKTKKSVIEAKKDLIKVGLIQVVTGTGHTNSTYYFCFNYPGSKITPQWGKKVYPMGGNSDTHEGLKNPAQGDSNQHPNQINISIHNNQTNEPEGNKKNAIDKKLLTYDSLIEDYGLEVFNYAYKEAKKRGLETQMPYIRAICKERTIFLSETKFNQNVDQNKSSWFDFLSWASKRLTESSVSTLRNIQPYIEGETIFISDELSEFLQQVIVKYFKEEMNGSKIIIFGKKETSRL